MKLRWLFKNLPMTIFQIKTLLYPFIRGVNSTDMNFEEIREKAEILDNNNVIINDLENTVLKEN